MNALATNGDTLLHVAMRLSDENQCLIITKLLVEAGCSPCELDADDKLPIHVAVARGFVSVVEYLLALDVPLPSRILFAALRAVVVKRVEMIRLLISQGANVHMLNPNGDALLHITMRSLDRFVCLEIAGILIDAGCNPSARNLRGETPLRIAAKQGYHEIVNYLILFSSPLDISSLLQGDPAVRVRTIRSLVGNTDGLRMSPEQEVGVLVVQQFLHSQDKCLAWAKVFVGAAGDLFVRSSGSATLVDIAMRRGFGEVEEYLNSLSHALNAEESLPPDLSLNGLQCREKRSMIPFSADYGADVSHLVPDAGHLLHFVLKSVVAEDECLRITKSLCEAGCNFFAPDTDGHTPLHLAITRIFPSVVAYFLSREVPLPSDILFFTLDSHPSGVWGDFQGWTSIISSLVRKGANIHAQDRNQNTLLHRVVSMGSVPDQHGFEVIKIFIKAGCSASIRNVDGKLPIEIAMIHVALISA